MKELEDLPGFPAKLREYQTDFIGYLATHWPVYDHFLGYWRHVARLPRSLVDLCSGSGQPAISLRQHLGTSAPLTLTDKYPHRGTITPPGVCYEPRSVDARRVRVEPDATYTMFNAFHHFKPMEQAYLVRRLKRSGAEAFLVEILEPTLLCMAKVLFATTVGVLLLTPFIRPFRWDRLLFTYLIPVNVLTIMWDGVLSVLRSRTAAQYRVLLAGEHHGIRVLRLENGLLPLTVIHIEQPSTR